jgi:endonuclease/exonuclease/phosphatase family metal-dependent hydrolase
MDAIRAVLAETAPDVCALQEIWASRDTNQAEFLARELGLHCYSVPSPRSDRWQWRIDIPDVTIGNAILSRWPIVETDAVSLPTGGAPDEGRMALAATIDSPAGRLPVITTQLNSAPHASAVRCEQVVALARLVAKHASSSFPAVLTGDFNAQPDSDEVRRVEGHLTAPAVEGQLLIDSWRYVDGHDPGLTWSRNNPHVAATYEPSARIDYVFVGPPGTNGLGHVRSAGLIGDSSHDGVWPSDHAGVRVDLALPAGR